MRSNPTEFLWLTILLAPEASRSLSKIKDSKPGQKSAQTLSDYKTIREMQSKVQSCWRCVARLTVRFKICLRRPKKQTISETLPCLGTLTTHMNGSLAVLCVAFLRSNLIFLSLSSSIIWAITTMRSNSCIWVTKARKYCGVKVTRSCFHRSTSGKAKAISGHLPITWSERLMALKARHGKQWTGRQANLMSRLQKSMWQASTVLGSKKSRSELRRIWVTGRADKPRSFGINDLPFNESTRI